MNGFIPPFDWRTHVMDIWIHDAGGSFWIVLMGFLVAASCGLVGVYLQLRRMALIGDAISHSLLPGIALAFLLTSERAGLPILTGALLAGIATVVLIEWIHQRSRIKPDAAIGIVFSAFFAVGVCLITVFSDHVDLDADCVLYGEIGLVILEPSFSVGGQSLAPLPIVKMGATLLCVITLIGFFYKELLVTSFDRGLAASLGISPRLFHYGLTMALSLVVVGAFRSVGAILVIAMLIFPGATARLLADRLPPILWLSALFAALASLAGYHLAIWLNSSIAAAMAVASGVWFIIVWILSPRHGLAGKLWRRRVEKPQSDSLAEAA